MSRIAAFAILLGLGACEKPNAEAASPKPPTTASASGPSTAVPGDDAAPTADTVVATWTGGQVTYGQLSADTKTKLMKLKVDYLNDKYSAESDALQNMIVEQLMDAEAKKRGLADTNALLDQEVKSKVSDPTDAEIQDFYNQVQRRLGGKSLAEVKDQLVAQLRRQKEQARFGEFIEGLKKAQAVNVTLAAPVLPRFDVSIDDDPMKGNKDAKVTIVQFAEFQCPYCGKAHSILEQVMKDYDGKVRMVFRDFPLGFHENAIPAAIAANCAAKQSTDKYWTMFDQMMNNQRALTEEDLTKYATEANVNLSDWNTCRKDPAQLAEVQKDIADGQELGVTGTPAFFIDGIMLSGALPYDQFKAIIDRELAGS